MDLQYQKRQETLLAVDGMIAMTLQASVSGCGASACLGCKRDALLAVDK